MLKKIFFALITLFLTTVLSYAVSVIQTELPLVPAIEPIRKSDRILILAPHPDDETIGCAGIIQEALRRGARVNIAYLTNGDHNEIAFIVYEKRLIFRKGEFLHMGEVRRKEAIKAVQSLGVNEANLEFLGYPDFGTFTIFLAHWQDAKPFKSLLTRVTKVPYKENLSFGAPYKGESILEDLKSVIKKCKPNKIFVSHPADTNADHRALYLFLQIALGDLKQEIPAPKIYPYLIHCVGWPSPRRYHPELSLSVPGKFLDSQIQWSQHILSPEQLDRKHKAVFFYKSQTESSAFYLLSFVRKNEFFGDYPHIELKLINNAVGSQARKQSVSFVGVSNMYEDIEVGPIANLDDIIEGKGYVSYALGDDSLLIRINKTKVLSRRFGVVLYLFGYNQKIPFGKMPKIRIIAKYNKFKVFDARKMIKPEGVAVEFNSKEVTLKVPLKVLGGPDFILTSMKTYAGILPVDTVSFRRIDIIK